MASPSRRAGCDSGRVTEPRTQQPGPHHELTHVAVRRPGLEPGHPLAGVGRVVGDRDRRERLQAMGMHPDIGIGHPHSAGHGLAQPRQRRAAVARGLVDEASRAGGERLPARVAQAATERVGVVEQRDGVIVVALAQRDLGPQRLGEGLERHPALALDERERVVEHLDRVGQLAAQQQCAPEDRQRPRRLADVATALGERGRLLEQADRRLVVRPVGERLAAHAQDGGALPVVLGQRGGPLQPGPRRHSATALDRDEAEHPAGLARDLAVGAGLGQRERLVQDRRALLVTAANGVHQRGPERDQRPRQQRRVTDAPRLRARLPQARDAGLDGAGSQRRAPRLELTESGGPIAHGAGAGLVGRSAHARVRHAAQLAAEQHLARVGVLERGADVARPRETAHEQLVNTVVELIQRDGPGGQRGGVERSTSRQRLERRIPEHSLAHSREAPTLDEQPRVEVRPGAGIDPLQQPAASKRVITITGRQRQHVHAGPRRPPQLRRVPAHRAGDAERATQLRQRPAQRRQRIVGLAEDQAGQPRPRDRPLGQDQISEHGPRLVPARRHGHHPIALDLRRSQQADHEP